MTFPLTSLGFAVTLIAIATTTTAVAQEPRQALLTDLEVRQLAARSEPADHVRLAGHFGALADRYADESRRHTSMALGATAQSGRQPALAVHCRQLAALDAELESSARELATFHERASRGAPSAAPADPGKLTTGVGARKPDDEELAAFLAKAAASNDHRALAEYFTTLARRYTDEAKTHTSMAAAYRGTRSAPAAVHCDRLVQLARNAASEARAAADQHSKMTTDHR
jgi:hypothetical protein